MKTPTQPRQKTLAAAALYLLRNQPEVGFWDFHELTGAISCREAMKALRRLGWRIISKREPHTLKTGRIGYHVKYSLTGENPQKSGALCD
jgi:hypothetical protein